MVTGTRVRGWGRIAVAGGVITCVVLISFGCAAAVVIPSSNNVSAPYRGALWSGYNQAQYACLSKARFGMTPQWSNATGVGGWIASSNSRSCSPLLGGTSWGMASTILTIAIPIRIPNGSHSVQVTSRIAMAASQGVHFGGACPAPHLDVNGNGNNVCRIYAEWCFAQCFGAASTYLFDATNSTYSYSNTSFPNSYNYTYDYNSSSCSSFKCTYSNFTSAGSTAVTGSGFNLAFTWYFSTTAAKSHHYWVVLAFNGYAGSMVQGYPASTAAAYMNVGTFGNQFNVTGIKIV
ncbi:MAG TPA: hypothetical protein VFF67_01140 [Thermoplasmata archaeon]|nr:hypothetical protein [Thermoplasmata archaeon]